MFTITLDNKEVTEFDTIRKGRAFQKNLSERIGEQFNFQNYSYNARITTNF